MADVKDGDIVFEYPDDDDEIPGSKLPEEKEVELKETAAKASPKEVTVNAKEDEFDLEIEDDIQLLIEVKNLYPKKKLKS
jgi:hypothetical protein